MYQKDRSLKNVVKAFPCNKSEGNKKKLSIGFESFCIVFIFSFIIKRIFQSL